MKTSMCILFSLVPHKHNHISRMLNKKAIPDRALQRHKDLSWPTAVFFENNIKKYLVNAAEMPYLLWIITFINVITIIISSSEGICFIR